MTRQKNKSGRKKTVKIETKRKTRAENKKNYHVLKKLRSNKTCNDDKLLDNPSKVIISKKKRKDSKVVDAASKVIHSKKKSNVKQFGDNESKVVVPTDKSEKMIDDESKVICSKNDINEKFVEDESKILCSDNKSNNEELMDGTSTSQVCEVPSVLKSLRHNNRIDGSPNQCHICFLQFSNKFNLQRHLTRFMDPRLPCDQCGTKFSNKKQLTIHIISAHQQCQRQKVKFICPICNQIMKLEFHLQAHLYHNHDSGLTSISNEPLAKSKTHRKTKKSIVDDKDQSDNFTKTSIEPVAKSKRHRKMKKSFVNDNDHSDNFTKTSNDPLAKSKRHRKTKKSFVDDKDHLDNFGVTSNQPVEPNSLQSFAATQSLENSATLEKFDQIKTFTSNDSGFFGYFVAPIAQTALDHKNDKISKENEQIEFVKVNNTEPLQNSRDFPEESDIGGDSEEKPLEMINALKVPLTDTNFTTDQMDEREKLIQNLQTSEEVGRTENNTGSIDNSKNDANLSDLRENSRSDDIWQKVRENNLEKDPCNEINLAKMASSVVSENLQKKMDETLRNEGEPESAKLKDRKAESDENICAKLDNLQNVMSEDFAMNCDISMRTKTLLTDTRDEKDKEVLENLEVPEKIDNNGVPNDRSVDFSGNNSVTEKSVDVGETEKTDNSGIFNDNSVNLPGKYDDEKSLKIFDKFEESKKSDNTRLIDDTSCNLNEKNEDKSLEISQNCEESKKPEYNSIMINGVFDVNEKKNEEEKSFEVSQKCQHSEKSDNPQHPSNKNIQDNEDKTEYSHEVNQNLPEIEQSDDLPVLHNTSPNNTNIHEKKDKTEKSLEVNQNFPEIEQSDDLSVSHNVSANSMVKLESLKIFHSFGEICKTDNIRLNNNASGHIFGKCDDKEISLEILKSFAEIARTDATPSIEITDCNIAAKNIAFDNALEMSKNGEENVYRNIISDGEIDDSTDGSESDQSEFAEALDDIFHETFENDSKKYFYEETENTSTKNTDPQNDDIRVKSGNLLNEKIEKTFATTEALDKVDCLFAKINIILPEVKNDNVKQPEISQNHEEIEKIDTIPAITEGTKIDDTADSRESNQSEITETSADIYQETSEGGSKIFPYEKMESSANTQDRETSGNSRNTLEKIDNCINNESEQLFSITSAMADEVDVPLCGKTINLTQDNDKITVSDEIAENCQNLDETDNPPILDFSGIFKQNYETNSLEILQTPRNIENNNITDLISDGTESSCSTQSFASNPNESGFDAIFHKTLESEAANYFEQANEFVRDNALRAQYGCKHCYVSVTRLNITHLPNLKKSMSSSSEIIEKSSHQIYLCPLCPEIFFSESLRKEHIDCTHTVIPSMICDRMFPNKTAMRRHYRLRHLIGRYNKGTCVCGIKMDMRPTLEDHFFKNCMDTRLVKQHISTAFKKCEPIEKTQICGNCGKDFWVKSCLDIHLLTCTNANPAVTSNSEPVETSNSEPMNIRVGRKFGQGPVDPNERVCRYCFVKFMDPEKLLMHEQIYASSENHRCAECDTTFPKKHLLDAHSRCTHNLISGARYVCHCEICHQGFSKSIYRRVHMHHIHSKMAPPVMIQKPPIVNTSEMTVNQIETADSVSGGKCNVCKHVFVNRKRFIEHAIYYKCDEMFHCTICNTDFEGQYNAHHHNKMTHYSENMRKAYPYKCTICEEGFIYKAHLRAHKLHVHNETPKDKVVFVDAERDIEVASVSITPSNFSTSQNRGARIHTCATCETSFPNRDLLVFHIMEYQNDGDFLCMRCDKKCRTASLLLDHLCLNHSSTIDGSVQCRICEENFLTPPDWMSHVKHFHTNDAREPSEFYVEINARSDKDFGIKDSQLVPTNSDISRGVTYNRIVDEIDGNCPENVATGSGDAGEETHTMSNLPEIGESKKTYVYVKLMCNVCSTYFRDPTELAKHKALWVDEGPYMCEICGRRFTWMRFYQEHRMKHFRREVRDDRRYCAACNENFDTIHSLNMHKAHIHGNKSANSRSQATRVSSALESEGNQRTSSSPNGINETTGMAPFYSVSANLMYNKMEALSRPQEMTIVKEEVDCEPENEMTKQAPACSVSAELVYNAMEAVPLLQEETIVKKEANCEPVNEPIENAQTCVALADRVYNKLKALPCPQEGTIANEQSKANCEPANETTEKVPAGSASLNLVYNNVATTRGLHEEMVVNEAINLESNYTTEKAPFCNVFGNFGYNNVLSQSQPRMELIVNKVTNREPDKKRTIGPSSVISTIFGQDKMVAVPRPHGGMEIRMTTNCEPSTAPAATPSSGMPVILAYTKMADSSRPLGVTIKNTATNPGLNKPIATVPACSNPAIHGYTKKTSLPRSRGATSLKKITSTDVNVATPSCNGSAIPRYIRVTPCPRPPGDPNVTNIITNHKDNSSILVAPSRGDQAILGYVKTTPSPRPPQERNVKNKAANHGRRRHWTVDRLKKYLMGDYRYHDLVAMNDSSIAHSMVEVRKIASKRKAIDTITIDDESPINTPNVSSKKLATASNTSRSTINGPDRTRTTQIPNVSKQLRVVTKTNPPPLVSKGSIRILDVNKMFQVTNPIHSSGLTFTCKSCNLSFDSEDSLNLHIQSAHPLISVPPVVDITDDSKGVTDKEVNIDVTNQGSKTVSNCVNPSGSERSVPTQFSSISKKFGPINKGFVSTIRKPSSSATLRAQSSEKLTCQACSIIFVNANLLRLHQACVHNPSTTAKIQHDDDLMITPILPSEVEPEQFQEGLQWPVNSFPISSNGPTDEPIIERQQSSFGFESVMLPIYPGQFNNFAEKPVEVAEEMSIDQSASGSNASETSLCEITPVGQSTSNPTIGALKVRSFAGILKNLRRKTVRKRKNVPAKMLEPAEKRTKGSVYDPIAFEELCRQHNVIPRTKTSNNEVPLVTLM